MASLRFDRKNLTADMSAGLTTALVTIPDGMASAILAGVNPIHGLYALMTGTPIAAILTSSQFMYVSLTGAISVTAGSVLARYGPDERVQALIVLTILAGLVQLLLGLLKLGSITRFISNSVMTGFMTGVALLIVLGQLGDLTGYDSAYSNKVFQTIDLALHFGQVHWPTLGVGLATIALILLTERTPLAKFSMVVALGLVSLAVWLLNIPGVAVVEDVSAIPDSLPRPVLPDIRLIPELVVGGISVAIIGLVQAAGVSKTVPNADGSFSDVSRDFTGQGAGNVVAGFFQGMPIGGTMSETSVNVNAGARSRWANIFSGVIIIVLVLVFGGVVAQFAMPAIAALLVVAGFQSIDFEEVRDVWDISWPARLVMIVTFIATLAMPVHYAVFLGVALSLMLFAYRASTDIEITQITTNAAGDWVEQPAPATLTSRQVHHLEIYGSVFFASASMLEHALPDPTGTARAVVVLRLRGRQDIGSTFILVLERYAEKLRRNNGKLILAGVSQPVKEQIDRTETTEAIPDEDIFLASDQLGQSMLAADQAARAWIQQG
jgi:SulP family sulfate permease